MKKFLINILALLYIISSLFILCFAIVLPFTYGSKDAFPNYISYIIWPFAIIICASQSQCLKFFDKHAFN